MFMRSVDILHVRRGNKRDWKEPTQAIKIPDTKYFTNTLYLQIPFQAHGLLVPEFLVVTLLNQRLFLQYTGSVPLIKHQPTSA